MTKTLPLQASDVGELLKDFGDLLSIALRVNDNIGTNEAGDAVVYEGSTNDVDDLRNVVNRLHYKWHNIVDH